jgi:hypothetical protein
MGFSLQCSYKKKILQPFAVGKEEYGKSKPPQINALKIFQRRIKILFKSKVLYDCRLQRIVLA